MQGAPRVAMRTSFIRRLIVGPPWYLSTIKAWPVGTAAVGATAVAASECGTSSFTFTADGTCSLEAWGWVTAGTVLFGAAFAHSWFAANPIPETTTWVVVAALSSLP